MKEMRKERWIMKKAKWCLLILPAIIALPWMGQAESAPALMVTDSGSPKATIVLGETVTQIEKRAAEELAKYVKGMSGTKLRIEEGEPEIEDLLPPAQGYYKENIILIGRPQTNSKIKEFCAKGLVKLSPDYPGLDGFIIKSISYKGRNYLVLGGSTDRATLYAVYHLLENIFKVGFFEDGDQVPEKKTLIAENIDIAERPYFPHRKNLGGWPFKQGNSMNYWSLEEWQRWIDWNLKKKFNILYCHQGQAVAWKKTWKEFGLKKQGEPTEWDLYQSELYKKVISYARGLGLRIVCPGFYTWVPSEVREVYPDCKYIEIQWGQATPYLHLRPEDPMFSKVVSTFIKNYISIYGTDHIYEGEAYGEVRPGSTPEENHELKVAYAKAGVKGMREADPQGVWYLSGWTFTTGSWTKQLAKDFLDSVPNDAIYIIDTGADFEPWGSRRGSSAPPIYKDFGYFYGKTWGFGVVHALGGDTGLHGDMRDLIKRVKDMVNDPKASNCKYFYINPEAVLHNFPYYELCARLAWNPEKVELDSFLEDYAILRYGERSAHNMLKCLKELEQSVYSTHYGDPGPFYHYPLGVWEGHFRKERSAKLSSFIRRMRNALTLALAEKDRQKDNPLYQRDLLDMTREYVGELFSFHMVKARKAFSSGNKEAFEKAAKTCLSYLDKQERLLSADSRYCLLPEIKKQMSRPGIGAKQERKVKVDLTYWINDAGWNKYPWCVDYAKKDLFELVKFYYHPRIEFYLDTLRKKMNKKEYHLPANEMKPGYIEITKAFIEKPLIVKEEDKYPGTTLRAVEEIFSQIKVKDEKIEAVNKRTKSYKEAKPAVIADDEQTGFWEKTGVSAEGYVGAPVLSDNSTSKVKGRSSLKIEIPSGTGAYPWLGHSYEEPQDWSGNKVISFYWYGADTGKMGYVGRMIYITLMGPTSSDYNRYRIAEDFSGWKQVIIPLDNPDISVSSGDFDLSQVTYVEIQIYNAEKGNKWYLDRLTVDVKGADKD